jgi:hypothetical protein
MPHRVACGTLELLFDKIDNNFLQEALFVSLSINDQRKKTGPDPTLAF